MTHHQPRITLWTDDLLMTIQETREPTIATGARTRLWCWARRRGGRLPAESSLLARYSGVDRRTWDRISAYILPGWERDGDEYVIRRIVDECKYLDSCRSHGKEGGDKAWRNRGAIGPLDVPLYLPSPSPSPSPSPLKNPNIGVDRLTWSGTDQGQPKDGPRPNRKRPPGVSRRTVDPPGFAEFWALYPRKVKRTEAVKAWAKASPPIDRVLLALSWQVESEDWLKDSGEFIPHPTTYLNQGRWEDEPKGNGRPKPAGFQGIRNYVKHNAEIMEVENDEKA